MKKPVAIITVKIYNPREFEVAHMLLMRAIRIARKPETADALGITQDDVAYAEALRVKIFNSFFNIIEPER